MVACCRIVSKDSALRNICPVNNFLYGVPHRALANDALVVRDKLQIHTDSPKYMPEYMSLQFLVVWDIFIASSNGMLFQDQLRRL